MLMTKLVGMTRKFHIAFLQHEEGVSVSCPELPGCHSQGSTIAEAHENIRAAIEEYLEVYGEPPVRCEVRELEITRA
jgi:predicted RNase H-like HicB family nuclease